MDDLTPGRRAELAGRHVAELVQELDPGAFVTGFALVAEVVDADGERALWLLAPSEAKSWTTLGLLGFALQQEQAAAVAAHLQD